jgi:hypothetical protein
MAFSSQPLRVDLQYRSVRTAKEEPVVDTVHMFATIDLHENAPGVLDQVGGHIPEKRAVVDHR